MHLATRVRQFPEDSAIRIAVKLGPATISRTDMCTGLEQGADLIASLVSDDLFAVIRPLAFDHSLHNGYRSTFL